MNKRVFVGLSGGVDSAVCALLLKNQGYYVVGVFLKNWSGEEYGLEDSCPWKEDLEWARRVAEFLNIELKVYNFEKEYRELVIEDFFSQYSIGNTPNPDILCNKFIKFDKFLTKALEDGADYIATGHYAKTDGYSLFQPKDEIKDQTYFLHQLTEAQLSKTLFPLSDMTKSEVRKVAKESTLPNYNRKDSQGICFVGKVDIREFLKQELTEKAGDIVDADTHKVVGKHIGVWFYTIGQRQGLNIGGVGEPYYVASKDVENNILYVVQGKYNKRLWNSNYVVSDFHAINTNWNINSTSLSGITRYRAKQDKISIVRDNETERELTIKFSRPQWAGAIGQSIVVYDKGVCIGGGVITQIVD
jgi:tRNA-uridine 2-sulfurtransferase